MEPSYTRLFYSHLLGVKDPTIQITPDEVTSYCKSSGLTFMIWFDDYNNAFMDPTCIAVHINGSFSTSSSSSSVAGSSSQGTYASNSTAYTSASTSYGIYHGPLSPHNVASIVPTCYPQSKPHADLYAAGVSLQNLHHIVLLSSSNGAPPVRNVVIVTDSNYLVSCLTENVTSWNSNGYKNAKGKKVTNCGAVKWVESLVVGLERRGVGVRFWKVDKKENLTAASIAKKALEQEELGKSTFRVQLQDIVRIPRP